MGALVGTDAHPRRPARLDVLLAALLTVAGELEVLLGPAGGGSRLVSALALPVVTLPLAWRRDAPLPVLATGAGALLLQALLGGFLAADPVVARAALVVATYSVGRHVTGGRALALATVAGAVVGATLVAFDPAIDDPAAATLTLAYIPLPALVGRWMRAQALLRRELEEKGAEIERERDRDARRAADEERMRIAGDLQAAATDGLEAIVRQAAEVSQRLHAGDVARARELLASIAATAREALADVRRVLGILRRDAPPPLSPGGADATRPAVLDAGPGPAAPEPPPARRERSGADVHRRARRLDLGLVAVLLIGAEFELAVVAAPGDQPVAALTAVLVAGPLVWRRQRPVTVAAAVLGAVAVQSAVLGLDSFPVFDAAAVVCAAYAIGAHAEHRPAAAGLVLAVLGSGLHAAVFYPDGAVPAVVGGAAVPWIVGRTVRGRRLLAAELEARAERARHAREQERAAAALAERVRVARELHDAVAHSVSVVAIQAGGAGGIAERDPQRTAQAAALIQAVARDALAELGRLVRPPGADEATAGRVQPSLARVDALAQRAREGGLPVEVRVEGEPGPLTPGVDLAAYRVVQEALANTSKHAGAARAWVVVRYGPHAVEVEVADDGRGPRAASAGRNGDGHGLAGIRERVALYRGTVHVGRGPRGGFIVRARLPIERA